MALKDLIVPKWKHSRAEVRLNALDAVGNDLNLLREMAETDSSPQVRAAAIRRIDDVPVLEAIMASEKDEQVRNVAIKQRESILKKIVASSRDQQAAVAALEKLDNEKVTAVYLCENSCDISVQRALVNRITSHQLLSKITECGCAFEIAEQIVEQISEKELLQRIARKASNKKIRIIAQEKIDTLFTDPLAREREITTRLKQCCNNMDIQVSPQTYDQAVALLEVSRNVWNKYDPERCHPLADEYAAAERLLIDRIKQAEAQKIELELLERLCLKAEQLLVEPAGTIQEQFDLLQTQWNGVDRSIIREILTVSLDDRFNTACRKLQTTIQTSREASDRIRLQQESLERACSELEHFMESDAAPDEGAWRRLLAHWESLSSHHAPDEVLKKRIADVTKRYQDTVDAKLQSERNRLQDEIENVERIVTEMEAAARTELQYAGSRYRKAVRLKQEWDRLRPECRERKAEHNDRFITAYDTFMSIYHEWREQSSWREWAGENAKKKLLEEIGQIEDRIEQGESPVKIARKISLFDNRWKQAAGGEHGTTGLDDRYSEIREHLFSMALTKKNELFETLKTILAASDGGNQSEEVKALQKQWHDIGYLPPELEKDLSDLFYEHCNTFFEQRKEQHQKYSEELRKNCALREEICVEAAKLSESSEWKATKDAFAQLQQRWDESWPAPHKQSRDLWLQLNSSRERFFERYHEYQLENDKVKEKLCENAEQLLEKLNEDAPADAEVRDEQGAVPPEPVMENDGVPAGEPPSVSDTETPAPAPPVTMESNRVNYGRVLGDAVKLRKSWKESGPASMERSNELWERFNGTLTRVFSIIDEEHRKNYDHKEALVKEAETIALSEEWNTAAKRFQEIRAEWKRIRPAARRDEHALWNRLQEAGNTFFGRRRAHFDSRRTTIREKLNEKKELIAELEIMVSIAGKSPLLKTAQNKSAAEILKKGIDLRNRFVVDGDSEKTYANIKKRVLEIIELWDKDEPLPGRESYQLERRFDELLRILKRR